MATDDRDAEIDDLIDNLDRDYRFRSGAPTAQRPGSSKTREYEKEQDFAKLVRLWISERTCPDILPYDEQLMNSLTDRLREQVEFIEMATADPEVASQSKLKLLLVESELERIKFLVRGYVRARLHKIDKYYMYLSTDDSDVRQKLSVAEQRFVVRRATQLKRLYDQRFLSNFKSTPKIQRLDDNSPILQMVDQPDLDDVIFIRVLKDIPGEVVINKEDSIELRKGNIYVLPYITIRKFIAAGEVEFV
ncbi:hypothetical protein BZA70DRAFT_283475 [Myxozyma melibiosi]|uniref:DNA replication complex GINS protein SLD5 n=1 Tax=Myxozyma melibiosi TaxID=54550 RepID=A0ABR1F0H2_9ASCO